MVILTYFFFRENVVKNFISNSRALTPVLGAMKKFKLFYQSKTACLKFMEIQQIREKKTSVAMQDKRLIYHVPKMKSSCLVLLIDGVEKLELKA